MRFSGGPVALAWAEDLRACRGKLRFGPGPGQSVHAASFLRERSIVLDRELKAAPGELSRVALHELFHFVWLRTGNPERQSWEELVRGELGQGARGELGWSAELRRQALRPEDVKRRSRRWREYVCESFCDSAAWAFGILRTHGEFTLEMPFRAGRRRWFAEFWRHRQGVFPI